jgi:hypothetical protein
MNDHASAVPAESAEEAVPVDPAVIQRIIDGFRAEQNLVAGLIAGFGASLVGAGLWMVVTVLTGYQIGWMAVGIGFLVGLAIRYAGKGIDSTFAVAGAVFSLFGCLLGNLLTMCQMIANQFELPLAEVLMSLTPASAVTIVVETFSPIDLLFYGIAVFEGYKLSTRQITPEELEQAMDDSDNSAA